MEKKIFRTVTYYGKYSGREVFVVIIAEDTKDNRERIMKSFSSIGDSEKEAFINKEIDRVERDLSGGDWDDPTAEFIEIISIEDAREEILKELEHFDKIVEMNGE